MKDLLQSVETGFLDTSFSIVCFLGDWVIENLYNFWSSISAAFNNWRCFLSWTFPCLLRKCSSNLFRTAGQRGHFFGNRFSFTPLLVFRNRNKLTVFLAHTSGHCFGCGFDMLKILKIFFTTKYINLLASPVAGRKWGRRGLEDFRILCFELLKIFLLSVKEPSSAFC